MKTADDQQIHDGLWTEIDEQRTPRNNELERTLSMTSMRHIGIDR